MLVKRSKSNKMQKNRKVSKKVNQRKKTKKVAKMRGGARSAYAHIKSNNELPEPGDNNNENYKDAMFEPSEEEQERTEHRFTKLKSLQENATGFNIETNKIPSRRNKTRGRLFSNLFKNPNNEPTNYARHAKRVGIKNRTHGARFRKSSSNEEL